MLLVGKNFWRFLPTIFDRNTIWKKLEFSDV
jgi:hypothetical protein